MTHESDGHIVKKKVAMDVICRENGHKYRVKINEEKKGCPECKCNEYDIDNEIYEGEG